MRTKQTSFLVFLFTFISFFSEARLLPVQSAKNQEETINAIKQTILPLVDWPEQTVVDRLILIKQEAAKVGVKVEWSAAIGEAKWKMTELRIREIPLIEAIRFTVGSTKLRCRFKEPNILYFEAHSEMLEPESK